MTDGKNLKPPGPVVFLYPTELNDINDPGWDDEEEDLPHLENCRCYSCIGWDAE